MKCSFNWLTILVSVLGWHLHLSNVPIKMMTDWLAFNLLRCGDVFFWMTLDSLEILEQPILWIIPYVMQSWCIWFFFPNLHIIFFWFHLRPSPICFKSIETSVTITTAFRIFFALFKSFLYFFEAYSLWDCWWISFELWITLQKDS